MECLRRKYLRATFFLSLFLHLIASSVLVAAQQAKPVTPSRPDTDSIIQTELVFLTVTVTDKKGNYIGGLNKNAFTVYDNKIPEEIKFFAAEDQPASIGVLIDFSASMVKPRQEYLATVAQSLLRFIKLSHEANEYFAVAFTDIPRLLIDSTRGREAFAEKLSKLKPVVMKKKTTALFDTCYFGLEKLKNSSHSKRALLLISDGQDNISHYKFKEVREALRDSDVMLYSISILEVVEADSSLGMEGLSIMNEFSSVSGGAAWYAEDRKQITAAFERVATELRYQYRIGFKPSNSKADGKWHQIKIKVTPPTDATPRLSNLSARTRSGYYAPRNLR